MDVCHQIREIWGLMALHVAVSPINADVCVQALINSIIAVIPHPKIPIVPIPNDTLLNVLCPDADADVTAFGSPDDILSLLLFYYL